MSEPEEERYRERARRVGDDHGSDRGGRAPGPGSPEGEPRDPGEGQGHGARVRGVDLDLAREEEGSGREADECGSEGPGLDAETEPPKGEVGSRDGEGTPDGAEEAENRLGPHPRRDLDQGRRGKEARVRRGEPPADEALHDRDPVPVERRRRGEREGQGESGGDDEEAGSLPAGKGRTGRAFPALAEGPSAHRGRTLQR